MNSSELPYYLALHFTSGIGSRRLLALMAYFGSAERVFFSTTAEISKVPGVGEEISSAIIDGRDSALAQAKHQLHSIPADAVIVTMFDEAYPESLKAIYLPPAFLFVRGNVEVLREERKVAIVGSRVTTDYGRQAAKELAANFVAENVCVVSGFAKGIDTIANSTAFEYGGKTIAVLGSGVDVIYPSTNAGLATQMIESGRGIIISELPLGTAPLPENFPARNRIVCGLSKATVVVESKEKGGSMITASLALDENREVFAIPGDISRPSSAGPNQLIRESRARLAVNASQVLEDLGWSNKNGSAQERKPIDRGNLTIFETRIVDVLEAAGGPLQVDALAERAGLEVQDILVQLLTLEFKSVVRQMAGKQFMLVY